MFGNNDYYDKYFDLNHDGHLNTMEEMYEWSIISGALEEEEEGFDRENQYSDTNRMENPTIPTAPVEDRTADTNQSEQSVMTDPTKRPKGKPGKMGIFLIVFFSDLIFVIIFHFIGNLPFISNLPNQGMAIFCGPLLALIVMVVIIFGIIFTSEDE